MIIEKAYAKLNLSLDVVGKMENGFHEIKTVMAPIDLYDELIFETNETNEMILIDNQIENNSILKAAKLFQKVYKTAGATIKFKKNIPLEAGLGGGSADSSATLRGLNRLFNLGLSLHELAKLAEQLGSDNVFTLYNQAAICEGRGEKLTFINDDFSFNVLLIKPDFGLSTKEVFEKCNIKGNKEPNNLLLEALKLNDYNLLNKNITNDLLESALVIKPQLQNLIDEIKKYGFDVFMSGSGTTLFVICDDILRLENLKNKLNVDFAKITQIKRYHN